MIADQRRGSNLIVIPLTLKDKLSLCLDNLHFSSVLVFSLGANIYLECECFDARCAIIACLALIG